MFYQVKKELLNTKTRKLKKRYLRKKFISRIGFVSEVRYNLLIRFLFSNRFLLNRKILMQLRVEESSTTFSLENWIKCYYKNLF